MYKQLTIRYEEYTDRDSLPEADRALLQAAEQAARGAYAPYSHFSVGAAVRLHDGTVVLGNNQENVAYPSGLCAERTALFAASAQHPHQRNYEALAIVGIDANGRLSEAAPCGACRQVMSEYESLQRSPMRVLCSLANGGVRVYGSVGDLLPFSFQF